MILCDIDTNKCDLAYVIVTASMMRNWSQKSIGQGAEAQIQGRLNNF